MSQVAILLDYAMHVVPGDILYMYILLFVRIKLHQKLTEAQERVVGYLTGREQVYSKLGDWFTSV